MKHHSRRLCLLGLEREDGREDVMRVGGKLCRDDTERGFRWFNEVCAPAAGDTKEAARKNEEGETVLSHLTPTLWQQGLDRRNRDYQHKLSA
jgi:hypothetical protein